MYIYGYVYIRICRFLDRFINNMKFQLEFTLNRLPMRLQHRAVHLAVEHRLQDVLFPKESNVTCQMPKPPLRSVLHCLRNSVYFCCAFTLGVCVHMVHSNSKSSLYKHPYFLDCWSIYKLNSTTLSVKKTVKTDIVLCVSN